MPRSPSRASGVTLAALRRATAADHDGVHALVDSDRLVEIEYYAAVLRGLIEAAEIVEVTLPQIPHRLCCEGLSPAAVTKRVAIDAEVAFLDDLAGPRPIRPSGGDQRSLAPGNPGQGTMLGLLYVHVGSALGGLHLLRVARTAPWWPHEREHMLLRPYGNRLADPWRAVLDALERLDGEQTDAAAISAKAGFDAVRESLAHHLLASGVA